MALDQDALKALKIERGAESPPKRRRVRIALLVAAVAVLAMIAWRVVAPRAVPVDVAAARSGADASVLNGSGYVVARRVATVSSRVTGQITQVLVEEGQRVSAGQVLAILDDRIAKAQLEVARSELDTAGRAVSEQSAQLDEARLSLGRLEKLRKDNLSSEADVDSARARAETLKARLAVANSRVETAKRNVELSERNLEDTVIRAPFDGVVTIKAAQPGEIVSPISAGGGFTRTGIATVVDMGSLEIEVDVNEAFINRVRDGQPVEAVLDAYPDWKIPAHVESIVPTADRQKATVKVRIAFEQTDDRILPEMGVQVRFLEQADERADTGVWVPSAALHVEAGQVSVFLVADGRARRKAVTTGVTRGDEIEIKSGIAAGSRVVTASEGELRDGSRVTVR